MTATTRRFQGDSDVWRIRALLREAFLANERYARSWHVARFGYARWHVYRNVVQVPLEDIAWWCGLMPTTNCVATPPHGAGPNWCVPNGLRRPRAR